MDGSDDILALSELITGYQNAYDHDDDAVERAHQQQLAALTPSTIAGASRAQQGAILSLGFTKSA